MITNKDPVVRDITQFINRSAGQHQRLIGLPVRDTMTDDRFNLHRVDTSQLGERDGVSVGGCRTDLPIQFADNEVSSLIETVKRDAFWLKWGFAAIAGGFLIAAVIHVSTK